MKTILTAIALTIAATASSAEWYDKLNTESLNTIIERAEDVLDMRPEYDGNPPWHVWQQPEWQAYRDAKRAV